jgi:hypothetical protein
MDVAGLTVLDRWYFGMAMALMLVPVDTALRRHVVRRRRTAIGD